MVWVKEGCSERMQSRFLHGSLAGPGGSCRGASPPAPPSPTHSAVHRAGLGGGLCAGNRCGSQKRSGLLLGIFSPAQRHPPVLAACCVSSTMMGMHYPKPQWEALRYNDAWGRLPCELPSPSKLRNEAIVRPGLSEWSGVKKREKLFP